MPKYPSGNNAYIVKLIKGSGLMELRSEEVLGMLSDWTSRNLLFDSTHAHGDNGVIYSLGR